jgi:ABC-type antimicrobial peptide transport system permease subunit
VIGVVKDFVMNSMYQPIEPVIILLDPEETSTLYVRTEPGATSRAMADLQAVFERFNSGYPFDYGFLDQDFESMYRSETVLGRLATVFAVIAILISCLGLFGLVSYSAEQRTKEIGIRKVLGASVPNLVGLLNREMTRLVIIGIAVATPVAYFLVQRWLEQFEFDYRIELGLGIFLLAGGTAIAIAWLTVSYLSFKTAMANPVKSLRYE